MTPPTRSSTNSSANPSANPTATPSTLAYESLGAGMHTVVFVHGFTQTGNSWRAIAEHILATTNDVRCVLVDLPGHGGSSNISGDLPHTAQMLVSTATEVAGDASRVSYVGYSLGARVVLQAVVDFPAVIHCAVVVSGNAGIDDAADRAQRVIADEALARRVLQIGTDAFLSEWLAQPLFAGLTLDQAQLADRGRNTATGLADSLRRCGQGNQHPLWSDLASSTVPLLAIAGARDHKYAALAQRLATNGTRNEPRIIPNVGHSAHIEDAASVTQEIAYWITKPTA